MKILIVTDAWTPQINGVVRTYENLFRELTVLGHNVKIMGPRDFPVHIPLPFYPEIELSFFAGRKIEAVIKAWQPDSVHIATEGPLGRSTRRVCLQKHIPFTSCYHTHFPDYLAHKFKGKFAFMAPFTNALTTRIIRNFHAPSVGLLVATPTLERALREVGFKGPFFQMSRGIDTSIFYTGPKTLFQDLPSPVALYVGRVSEEKNIEAFLEASWEGSKVVVGDGPALIDLKARFPNVHFVGARKGQELGECYRSADIFVFPSKTDTFGMVNIEALACGLPVAAYPVQGPVDIITRPEFGVLGKDLGQTMADALKAPGNRTERSKLATETYSWPAVARQFLAARPNCG